MTPPDLDARVAEAEAAMWDAITDYVVACGGSPGEHVYGNTRRQQAVADVESTFRDLHAALQAREGGEFVEVWIMYNEHGVACHAAIDEFEAWGSYDDDEIAECKAAGYTVRRLRCRVVEGE